MSALKVLLAVLMTLWIAACGGGGGDSGTSVFGSPGSGSTGSGTGAGTGTGTGATTVAAYSVAVDLQRSGSSTFQISSTESVQATATVTSASGSPVQGVIVTFTGGTAPSLTFAPTAATALTDANGLATVNLAASSATATGATTLTATATVAGSAYAASKPFSIVAGAVTGTVVTPAAINFVGATPSGTAIVIKGAGGNGRSESAVLQFRIVDANNTPVKGVSVTFQLNGSSGGASLQQTQGTSNSDGMVNATVSSGTSPASIVVMASVTGTSITAQSDTLIVSNSVAISGGFEIVAEKYNLDGRKTGDATTITAYVRDQFGNPVPDGVAVSFTTDYGVVASSTLGGCSTVNGTCTVQFRVQNPRPLSNGLATVTGVVRVGSSTQLVQRLTLNMAGASGGSYLALDPTSGTAVTALTMNSCVQSFELLLSDGSNHATAAGTTIATSFSTTGTNIGIRSGSPTLDQLGAGLPPTRFGVQVDVLGVTAPACRPGGVVQASDQYFRFVYSTPGGIVFEQRIALFYPQ